MDSLNGGLVQGSPLSRADLRSVNVNLCDMCVILSAKVSPECVGKKMLDIVVTGGGGGGPVPG